MSRATAIWTDRTPTRPAALFIASAVGSNDVFVVTAAGGVAGHGAIGVVVLFFPGSTLSQVVLMPTEASAS